MTHIATVKMWRKHYGFAEADDGSIVHITKEEIGGMALQPGLTVTCDLVPVEGHAGRVKGTNVTGEAIIPADTEVTIEDKKAQRAEWDAFKKEKIAVDGAEPAKKAKKAKGVAAEGAGTTGGRGAKVGRGRAAPAKKASAHKGGRQAGAGKSVGRGRGVAVGSTARSQPYSTGRGRGRGQ